MTVASSSLVPSRRARARPAPAGAALPHNGLPGRGRHRPPGGGAAVDAGPSNVDLLAC